MHPTNEAEKYLLLTAASYLGSVSSSVMGVDRTFGRGSRRSSRSEMEVMIEIDIGRCGIKGNTCNYKRARMYSSTPQGKLVSN